MTYLVMMIPFLLLAAVVFAMACVRVGAGTMWRRSGITAIVLCVLTILFDNVMIGAGLFDYPPGSITGIRLGFMPVEDFSYPVVASFLLPALLALLDHRADQRDSAVQKEATV